MVREKWDHFAVKKGDYLLSASGSTGAVRRASDEVIGAIPYTGIIRLWPLSATVNMEYLRLFMSARPFADQISVAKSGVGIEHFGPTHLKKMWICVPAKDEQAKIVEDVASQVVGLDVTIARTERQIGLIREYRAGLTTAVVTGKLDVRAASRHLPAQAEEPSIAAEDLTDDAELESVAGDGET
jgi:type I restriction enzyme, S subunit